MGSLCASATTNQNAETSNDSNNQTKSNENESNNNNNSSGNMSKNEDSKEQSKGDIQSRYAFRRTLGKGASCRVVEAVSKLDKNVKVAVKIMPKERPITKKLYEKEVELLTTLSNNGKESHDNVINYVEHEEDDYHYYIVTRLCEGGELFDRIVSKEEKYMFTEKKAAAFIQSALKALQFCHSHDIVHRDLKPENFVYASPDPNAEVVLIDFGCGTVVDSNNKEKTYDNLVGTAYYLAPELAYVALSKSRNPDVSSTYSPHVKPRTGDVLKQSDVWSIGVIAYVMMTGRAPFRGRTNQLIFESIVTNKVVYPEKDVRYKTPLKLSSSFKDFVDKVLVKDPSERLTLDQCLRHPWVQGIDASEFKLNSDVIRYLRQFNHQSKLKKAITRVLATNMTKEPEQQVKKHFVRLDANGDGFLSDKELALLLLDMGYAKTTALPESQEIIKQADVNEDGRIDFEEFKAIWYRKILSTNEQYIHRVFNVFDANGDGQIDINELRQVLIGETSEESNELNEESNEESKEKDSFYELTSLLKMIEEVDENGDNQISFSEFKSAMTEDMKQGRFNVENYQSGLQINEEEYN